MKANTAQEKNMIL